jgi:hypothetical protein
VDNVTKRGKIIRRTTILMKPPPPLIAGFTHFCPRNVQRAVSARAQTPASSTLPTSLTLISPPIPLSTTPASPAPAPSESRGVRRRLGGLSFHETPSAGLRRNGGGARAGSLPVLGFSKVASRAASRAWTSVAVGRQIQ